MNKITRGIILLVTIIVTLWFLYPSINWYFFINENEKELLKLTQDQLDTESPEIKQKVIKLKNIRSRALSLGLDLQGGVNIVLQVNEQDLRKQLLEKYDFDENKVNSVFDEEYKNSVDRALEVLRNRMDTFGVAEPSIRKTYDNKISIELPGMDNPQLIRDALSKVGKLEFRMVDEDTMKLLELSNVRLYRGYVVSREEVPKNFTIPDHSEWVPYWENDQYGLPKMRGWYVLLKKVELDGTMIKNARPDQDNYGRPKVSFELTSEGTDIFAEVTANNIKKRLAIVLDGKIKSAPVIQSEIAGGFGEITGDFTLEETAFLANVLKAGSLPVKLDIVAEKVIGPTLGKDSIIEGTTAALIGALIVVIFMIIYYKFAGLVAIVGLFFNIIYLIALLAGVSATLTLSGIAGIALTIGMAVDANIIIYERIREEMRRSRALKHAIENGYDQASRTIWDANLTTLFAAFGLYMFGTGTIKGFGITLAFGIIANIFASLFITKLIFDWWFDTFHPNKIYI